MATRSIAIIDSGGANIASLLYAFQRLGADARLTTDPGEIRHASRVVLPGVGAARDAMDRLKKDKLVDLIRSLTQPVLGICLGMQLLADASEEDDVECLGIIPGTVAKLEPKADFPVPNMGWCAVSRTRDHEVINTLDDGSYFYFVHSFALPVSSATIATADHSEPFSAVVCHENFVAAQFHPERSSHNGARLLSRFLGIAA